jgi:hypothetical protein
MLTIMNLCKKILKKNWTVTHPVLPVGVVANHTSVVKLLNRKWCAKSHAAMSSVLFG